MPRVSQDHLDARRQQILDAARRCFVRNGFHTTSMQDVLAEAGLSAGAVYRYFPGKEDIVLAIAGEALAQVRAAFHEQLEADDPPPLDLVVGRVLARLDDLARTQQMDRVVVQAWGEAVRSPVLAARCAETIGAVRAELAEVVAAHQARGRIPSDVPADHVARVLMSLVPGFLVQRAILGDVDPAALQGGLAALLAAR